jgi:hypothetical protein
MCDDQYDERTKAYWRALIGDEELEEKEDVEAEVPAPPLTIEPAKPKPKPLMR